MRAVQIIVYALCGFSNIGSVGMTLSAMSAIAPEQNDNVAKLAMRSLVAGATANFLNAALIGTLL